MSTSPEKKPADGALLNLMLLYAKHYLASGGPSSRLEDSLTRMGRREGRETEVFATPTGVFVTIVDAQTGEPRTSLTRIRETGTDLGRLSKLEHLLADFLDRRISVRAATETLRSPVITRSLYRVWQTTLAAFCAGFAISFDSYQRPGVALVSGAITALIWLLSTFFLKRHLGNPLFTDFIGAFVTLLLAAVAHGLLEPLSIEAYALGGIVLLVPGLALTTAISELAEQNLVSGTAKFMAASLAAIALGLAYLLFQQLAFSLDLREVLQPVVQQTKLFWVSLVAILVNVTCFGVIFKTPPRALVWSTLTGFMGWLTLVSLSSTRAAAAGPFLASVMVGTVSLALGRVFRQPSQLYSVPGIVGMLPGFIALNSFRYFASGDQDSGIAFSFKVAITAVSIVFGLMTARIPFLVGRRYRSRIVRVFPRLGR